MYKPNPRGTAPTQVHPINKVKETYLGPGQGIVGRIVGFTDQDGLAVVDSGNQKGVLKDSSDKGYFRTKSIRFMPGKSRKPGFIPVTDMYCEVDPITGIPINAHDISTYEGTIEHLAVLDKTYVYVIPTAESSNLGGFRTRLENAKPEKYQKGKQVWFKKKLGTNDLSDDYGLKVEDDPQVGSLKNDSGIDFVLFDQETDTMLILSQDPNILDGNDHSSNLNGNEVTLLGTKYVAFLTDELIGSKIVSDLGYPSDKVARGNYRQPIPLHQKPWDNTQTSRLDVAGMTPGAAKVGGKIQNLEKLVRAQVRKLKVDL